MRLKQTELKKQRTEMLSKQNSVCPLCNELILEEDAVLDHDHGTGKVRSVLHRSCNQAEGRIKSWINRSRFVGDHEVFLQNLIEYIQCDYSDNPEHPSHLTKLCKQFSALNKKEQIQRLQQDVMLEGKETKKQLTKLYRKLIKN